MKYQYDTAKEFKAAIEVFLWMGADIATNSKDLVITVYHHPAENIDDV